MNRQNNESPAELFDNFFGPTLFEPWSEILLEHANLKQGEHVLDLACGTGTVARKAAPMADREGKVVGVDINPGMLEVARTRPVSDGLQIEWQLGDASALDFPDNSFDLVLCQQGLQFFPDRWAALKEIQRILKADGRLALNLWQSLDKHAVFHALAEAEARILNVPTANVSAPFHFPDAAELKALLKAAGYKNIQISAQTLDAVFPSVEAFVELTLFATTAFLPEFDPSDEEGFLQLSQLVSEEIAPVLDQHRSGERLIFPMHWNIGLAYVQ
jgi:ubiquinone/menaquinone biosynthesis C-methylase UbiE